MRIPLRIQVFVPFAGLLAATITAVSVAGAWRALQTADAGIHDHVRNAAQVLVAAEFPLTDAVLRQTRGLSGAEFVCVDATGRVRASSLPGDLDYAPLNESPTQSSADKSAVRDVTLGDVQYVHQVVDRHRATAADGIVRIHLLYPQKLRRSVLRQALGPPAVIGGTALITAAILSWWLAARISRPIAEVREQFRRIAAGGVGGEIPLPTRNDELRELVVSVNDLGRQLQDRDEAVRRSARSSLLGQLSGGLCHHLRNAAAGAKLALQLYRRRAGSDADELDVALRQISLSEEYLQRLLTLGKPQAAQLRPADLTDVVRDVASLVEPAFKHRGVELRIDMPTAPLQAAAVDAGLLRQAAVNLLSNALDASRDGGWVEFALSRDADFARLSVTDGGAGPPAEVVAKLFEPFVTAKPDGVGLGLAASLRIAQLHGGTIVFRDRPHTRFEMVLPLTDVGPHGLPDVEPPPSFTAPSSGVSL